MNFLTAQTALTETESYSFYSDCEYAMTVIGFVTIADAPFPADPLTYTFPSPSQPLVFTLTYPQITLADLDSGVLLTFVSSSSDVR